MHRCPASRGWRVLLILLGLEAFGGTLTALQREELFSIDIPIEYGAEGLLQRLETRRREGPLLALHLSGGSARAFAHIGVLRRLEEQGVYPQVIATTSMGSIIGLLYAAGVPLEVIEDVLQTLDYGSLFTLKLPASGGIMDPRGLLAAAQALVGNPDLADLPIPIVVICEDLRSMRRVLISRGPFITVLQAAIAIPGALDPVRLEDFVLIDGGITNLVPIGPLTGLADFDICATALYDRDLEPNNPVTVLSMAINIAKSRTAVSDIKSYSPFLIRSDVEQLTYMDYRELPQIIEKGYEAAAARSKELQRELESAGFTLPSEKPPELAACRERYTSRWAKLKRELLAGRDLALPGGFGALQVHPLPLKRYRGPDRLEQSNYLALSYAYASGVSGLRIGAAGDLQGKWSPLLSLNTALWQRLKLQLDGFLFFSTDGTRLWDSYLYGRFAAVLPLLIGKRLQTGPYFQGELRLDLPGRQPTLYLSPGLEVHVAVPGSRRFVAGTLAWFFESPAHQGVNTELLGRVRLGGPLEAFGRGQLRAILPPATGGLAVTFNDFYRGVARGQEVGSFLVINGELILAPESLSFGLWELFHLAGFELSAFCDLLWEQIIAAPAPPLPSLGLGLTGEIALIGLLPLRPSLAAGYDLSAEKPFFSLSLSAPY